MPNSRFAAIFIACLSLCRASVASTPALQELWADSKGSCAGYVLSDSGAFDKGASTLSDAAKATLLGILEKLEHAPARHISIFGFSDSVGVAADKTRLSLARALAVRDFLLAKGLAAERVDQVRGLGPDQPVADNGTQAGRLLNRRVEIRFTGAIPLRKSGRTAKIPVNTGRESTTGEPERFALGFGYPDVRARLAVAYGLDLEAKFAFEQGIQIYTGRLLWNFWDLGHFHALVGVEGGFARFSAFDGLNGNGTVAEGFLGLEYPFGGRFKLSVDAGPAKLQANSEGFSYSTVQTIYNTAFYIYLF
jgi:hypothetical protein